MATAVVDLVRRHPALALFVLAMLIGAALIAPVALGMLPQGFVQLAALSASAAGLILAAVEGGRGGVRELLRRALIWRVGVRWWVVALLVPAVPAGLVLIATGAFAPGSGWPGPGSWSQLPAMLLVQIVVAGVAEELGWRGFALPRLQGRHTALASSLAIGGLHAAWHVPLFLIPGAPYTALAAELGLAPAMLGYSVLVVSLAVLMTWLFNSTRGSVLMAAVFHGSVNGWNGFLAVDRAGTAALFGVVIALTLLAAVVVVVYRPAHLARGERETVGDLPGSRAPAW